MLNILHVLQECFVSGNKATVATILSVDGSTYQREGARCVVLDDGRIVGVVSGGCVEADLALHAESVFETGEAKQVSYDFRDEADDLWGLGVGCNGALTLLLQCFDPVGARSQAESLLADFRRRVETEEPYSVATVVSSSDPRRIRPGYLIQLEPEQVMNNTASLQQLTIDGVPIQAFVERITPRPQLYIFGAGPDAAPLAKLGTFLEWRVRVVDHRPTLTNSDRFEGAELISVRRTDYTNLPVPKDAMTVVMTHNYEIDRALLGYLLSSPAAYVGALGPRRRTDKALSELAEQGKQFSMEQLNRLYAPIGLNLGADSPEEIAVAIIAEAQANRGGREAVSLKHVNGPLHSRSNTPFVLAPDGVSPGACTP